MMIHFCRFAVLLVAVAAPGVASAQSSPPPSGGGSSTQYWGAIGFTADGSYSSAWKMPSKAEAEAKVAVGCAKFGRGECKVVSFPGELCAGLATYTGTHSRRRWKISYTSGGSTMPEAQRAAIERCNADPNSRNRCQSRTVVCGDGR